MIPAVTGEDPRPDGREREVAHTQATPDEDRQELRLAVVMTGGVSLAVWMGGVAHEINRMLQGSHAAYEGLLDLTLSRARVDIVSGASAGGLNGALLATAIAHDVGLEDLRGARGH
ncbi:MAG: patatin-like phospholipase family protein [Thermoleophilaceae bacterium]|jgi:predicted acylesterase/phospholipase RssA|nr:patatin-like phospholipase family protein [Thermoleophilaceae bacterium]